VSVGHLDSFIGCLRYRKSSILLPVVVGVIVALIIIITGIVVFLIWYYQIPIKFPRNCCKRTPKTPRLGGFDEPRGDLYGGSSHPSGGSIPMHAPAPPPRTNGPSAADPPPPVRRMCSLRRFAQWFHIGGRQAESYHA
jgi:hypothetical protein